MALTVEEIARLAGVSRATVSRVVNHQPNVSRGMRDRVQRVIDEHNYRPNQAAQSLATRRTNAIGLLFPNSFPLLFHDTFFPRLIQGIAEVCNEKDYYLSLTLTTGNGRQSSQYQRVLRSGAIDGVIVANADMDDPLIGELLRSRVPFVLVGRSTSRDGAPCVNVDNAGGAQLMTEYLIGLGHRRIGIITGPLARAPAQDRLTGYCTALELAGLPFDDQLMVEGDFTEAGGYRAVPVLMPARPTAIFANSDLMALGAVRALQEQGLRVPDQVSVVGFDDFTSAVMVTPQLTTIAQPAVRLGETAAKALISALNGAGQAATPQLLPTHLVIRQSAAAPPLDAAGRVP